MLEHMRDLPPAALVHRFWFRVCRYCNGKAQATHQTFEMLGDARALAEQWSQGGAVPILRVRWNERLGTPPHDGIVLEEIAECNGKRVFEMQGSAAAPAFD